MRSGSRCRWSRWRTAAARARRACGAGCRTRPAAPPGAPPGAPPPAPPACCAATPGSARPASRPGWWPASRGSLRAETTTQLCSQGLEKRIWEFVVHREVVLAHEVPCWCWWRDAALGGRRVAEATEPGPTSQKKGGCRESLPAPPTVMATAGTAGRPSLWSSSWAASRSGCRARGSAGTPWGASSPSSSAAAGGGAGPWSSCCTVDNGTQFRYCSRSVKEKIFNDHLKWCHYWALKPYLQSLSAAGRGHEDVIRVHGAQHERGAVPLLPTEPAADGALGVAALQAAHAHARQVLRATFHFYLQNKFSINF